MTFELVPTVQKHGLWKQKVLYRFHGQDGATPMAGVVLSGNGHLYGTLSAGAANANGAVFSLVPLTGSGVSWKENLLHRFGDNGDGTNPRGALIFDATGSLYGTALGGGTHRGVVVRLKRPTRGTSWSFSVLYNLNGPPDGDHPTASLISDSGGHLYSTTESGGNGQSCQGGCGAVFKVSP
jgi:hypothetical protein